MNTAWLLITEVLFSNIVHVNSLSILAQATEVVLNKNEFNSLLLGQIIQLIGVLAGIGVSIKALRRNPPMSEELIKLSMSVLAIEARVTKLEGATTADLTSIEQRLAEGDDIFRNELSELKAVKATVSAMQQDLHIIKQQIGTLLANMNSSSRK